MKQTRRDREYALPEVHVGGLRQIANMIYRTHVLGRAKRHPKEALMKVNVSMHFAADDQPEIGMVELDALAERGGQYVAFRLRLVCPHCNGRHVDRGIWTEILHRTHLCEHCGRKFRPSHDYTMGVDDEPSDPVPSDTWMESLLDPRTP